MKSISILPGLIALTATLPSFATTPDNGMIHSIQDIPTRWTGVAGGIAEKTPAVFTIDRVGRVLAETHEPAYSVSFETTASVTIGTRTLPVTQVNVRQDARQKTAYEMVLFARDELVQTLFGGIVFNPEADSFSYLQYPVSGVRQFSFQAPRRH